MGNLHQHIHWALWSLTFIQSSIIIILLYFPNIILDLSGTDKSSMPLLVLLVPIIFILGTISPDIDLKKESSLTKFLFYFILPLFLGLGSSKIIFLLFSIVISKKFDTLFFLIFTLIGILFWSGIIALIDAKATHWGRIHSIIAGLILSIIIWSMTSAWIGENMWSVIVSLIFFVGYIIHLICDQVYHNIRKKRWNGDDKRYALKFWNNNTRFDPIIGIVDKIIRIIDMLRI